jgi:hypothetical protein
MTSLRELQRDVRAALLGPGDTAAAALVMADGLGAEARLQIYRHHVFTTLTAALQAVFPVVCRLVDERFFGYAADRYIRVEPPSGPCLFEYGATFPEFLAAFPPCRDLPYLGDVARLEWAMHRALHAPDAAPLGPEALRSAAPEAAGGLILALDESVSLLASRWPIDAIWWANQPGAVAEGATVDLRTGGVALEVRRRGDDVAFHVIAPAAYAFRRALADGRPLATATEHALAADPAFDLPAALGALFREGLPIRFTCSPSTGEND